MMIISDLPVMKKCCATCPFKLDKDGKWQNEPLAAEVIQRNFLQSQQVCHGTQKGKIWKNRCKGYWDYAFEIYTRLGLEPEKHFKNQPKK